ncbi:MAG: hypothetical protein HN985_13230 [Planctomycetaceae bacterium]|jgi:hypothetical protein|nr:hypothetical protein [Planctomycetaceae bacterium]MBT6920677.1 hypothetical protein [Planctomycetaceae bacterium]
MASPTRKNNSGKPRVVKRWLGGALIAGVVLLICSYFFLRPRDYSNDPRVVEIREIQEEARTRYLSGGGPSTQAEARAFVQSMEKIRNKMDGLPDDVRREMYRGGGNVFYSSMRQRIDDYFKASPAQRQQVLDQQIRQSDLMSKAFSEARAAREAQGPSTNSQQGNGQKTEGKTGSGQGSGRSSWASRSQGDRNEWFKNRILDRTTPEQRAKYVEYRRAASERREELGLPAGWP